jgi:hypothetical protein
LAWIAACQWPEGNQCGAVKVDEWICGENGVWCVVEDGLFPAMRSGVDGMTGLSGDTRFVQLGLRSASGLIGHEVRKIRKK